MRVSPFLLLAAGATLAALGQQPAPLAFEVASVKPAEPMTGKMMQVGVRNDGAMVTYSNMSMKELVQNAYGVKEYQVTGPAWIANQRFDISAKLPDNASADQAPEMLKALLKERFKMTTHTEKKDHPVYALVVGKGGPKLKAAENMAVSAGAPAPPPPPAPGSAPAPPAPPRPPGDGPGRGPGGGPPPGGMMMRMGPGGGHIEARAATVARFAEMISRFLDRPVVDETGIKGDYDFAADVSAEEMGNMMAQMKGGPVMMMGRGGGGPGGPGGPPGMAGAEPPPNAPEGGSVFQSVQEYGLKLEPKKTAMQIVTVDSVEKTPTEN